MRFCPFCAQENTDEGTHCAQCGKRLPPAPRRPGIKRADPTLAPSPSHARPPTTRFQLGGGGPATVPSAAPQPAPAAQSAPLIITSSVPQRGAPSPAPSPAPPPVAPAPAPAPAPARAPAAPRAPAPASSAASVATSTLGAVVVTSTRQGSGNDKPLTLSLGTIGTDRMQAPPRMTEPALPPPAAAATPAQLPLSARPTAAPMPRRTPDATPADTGGVPRPERARAPGTGPVPLPPPPSSDGFEHLHTPTAIRDATGSVPNLARPRGAPRREEGALAPEAALPILETRHAKVMPMPRVPNAGNPFKLAWYVIQVFRAVSQRRRAIKWMQKDIVSQQESLDGVLGMLGKTACELKLDMPAFAEEMRAINAAEQRREGAAGQLEGLADKRAKEDDRFSEQIAQLKDVHSGKLLAHNAAEKTLRALQDQRQKLRDEVGQLEGKMKAYHRSSEDKEGAAGRAEDAAVRAALRREADSLRNEARRLEGPRDAAQRAMGEIAKPLSEAERNFDTTQKEEADAKAGVVAAQRHHDQIIGEITAQQNQESTQRANAEREIARHHVTLGTMVNLHRVDKPELKPLYERVDTIRRGINGLEAEIEHLKAEKYARDKNTMIKGTVSLAGGLVLLVIIIILLTIALG